VKIKYQNIAGFLLVILILITILIFLSLTLHTVRSVLEQRRQFDTLTNNWYYVKLNTLRMLASEVSLTNASEYRSAVTRLQNSLTDVINQKTIQTFIKNYPDFRELIDSFRSNWLQIDKQLVAIETVLSERNLGSTAKKQTGQDFPLDDTFDNQLRQLISWLDRYNQQQLHAFYVLFYLLGITVILFALLTIPLGTEFDRRRRAEVRIRTQLQVAINAQEEERKRISLDLHDHLAQELSTSKYLVESMSDVLSSNERAKLEPVVSKIAVSLQKSISTTKSIAYDLHPPYLDHLGLVSALKSMLSEIEKIGGIRIDFISAGMDALDVSRQIKINLYRIVQEAMNNILDHSRATRVFVSLTASHPFIFLRVHDDGVGFNTNRSSRYAMGNTHMGIQNMRERTVLLKGEFTIKSKECAGTQLLIKVPFKSEEKHDTPE